MNNSADTEPHEGIIGNYIPVPIMILGWTANIIAMIVLTRKSVRTSMASTYVYLLTLVIADSLVLAVGLLPFWLTKALDIEVRTFSSGCCKVFKFLTYFITDVCNWIILSMNLDRLIAVCYPEKSSVFCTKKTARKTVAVVVVLMFLCNMHLLFSVDIMDSPKGVICYATNNFTQYVWLWIDLCLYFLFPFATMVVTNTAIVNRIVKSRKKISAHQTSDSAGDYDKRSTKRVHELSRTLFCINASFFILTLPILVYDQYESHVDPDAMTSQMWLNLSIAESLCTVLEFTNNAVHFFVFCLTIPKFRQEFVSLFQCKKE